MCGIAGIIDHHTDAPIEKHLGMMLEVMRKRGPDGDGEHICGPLAMGMRRLSVIDLDGGWQPLYSLNKQVVVFQNGEIYNHRALRKRLESEGFSFSTNSDTEVLAHGYAAWGIESLLQRIDGMYAISILDKRTGDLHLARDRFGEKPLFYAASAGRLAWSSHLLAIASLPWVELETDLEALDHYLATHFVAGPTTIFSGVRRLLPGQRMCLRVQDPQPTVSRYYRPDLTSSSLADDAELADTLESAVQSRLVSDVPVGVFLSGGLDSSLITAIAARHQPGISTFSMGFASSDHDESSHARRVADYCGTRHHAFVFDAGAFNQLLPTVASELDEPLGDQAALPLFWLCREARKHVTVALSGEGADELFSGYGYYRQFLPQTHMVSRWMNLLRGRPASNEASLCHFTRNPLPTTPSGFPLLTDVHGRAQLMNWNGDRINTWEVDLMAWLDSASDTHKRAMAADLATWLPDDLLVKFDRMAMANSLEGRAPFLDPAVAKLALLNSAPFSRMTMTESKVALRRVARHWLPAEILDRPKQGFVLPMRQWLRSWFRSHDGAKQYFSDRPLDGIDADQLVRLVDTDLASGIQRERLLFALLMLAEWRYHAKGAIRINRNRLAEIRSFHA